MYALEDSLGVEITPLSTHVPYKAGMTSDPKDGLIINIQTLHFFCIIWHDDTNNKNKVKRKQPTLMR